jgi:hypothetical protein
MKVKIFTVAELPAELAQAWLQHLRDFDSTHPDCHFQAFADTPEINMAEAIKMVTITPGLTFEQYFARLKP